MNPSAVSSTLAPVSKRTNVVLRLSFLDAFACSFSMASISACCFTRSCRAAESAHTRSWSALSSCTREASPRAE
nr:MAG TPA: hypothetical protein [Caudoviricetes sp.]